MSNRKENFIAAFIMGIGFTMGVSFVISLFSLFEDSDNKIIKCTLIQEMAND